MPTDAAFPGPDPTSSETGRTGRRFLLHTRASGGGGAERVFATLAGELAARGHRVTLAVDRLDGPVPAGVEIAVTGDRHGRAVVALARLIRSGHYDAAAGAVSVSNVKLLAARLLAGRRLPVAVSYHGFEEYRTGRLSALAYRGMPVINRLATRIVAVSDGLAADLRDRWGADPARLVRIHNPVPFPDRPPPGAADLATRPPVIAAVGRLSAEKGFADLVAAFALVRTPGARLVIGGDGPERQALEAEIGRLGLEGRVRLLGHVDGSAAVFDGARVAAVPSRTEAFGMAAVEALAAGLPVVAIDCSGPREILDAGRHGRLVPVGDHRALAAALDAALGEPDDPAPRRARAEDFSVRRGVDAWEALLVALCGR